MKLLEGYVENRTKEIALAAIFAALFFVTRQIKIDIFPTVSIRICAIFAYVPVMFLSWQYTWIVPIIAAFTSPEPVGSTIGLSAAIQVSYFSSRLLKKYRTISVILSSFTANLTALFIRASMGLFPFHVALPLYLFKATTLSLTAIVLVPPIWRILEYSDVFNFIQEVK